MSTPHPSAHVQGPALRARSRRVAWRARNGLGVATGRLDAGQRPLPEFLIIGTQRGGTTSLHRLLCQHPDVLPARFGKGVHYFDEAYDRPLSWYRAHFPTRRARRTVAASPDERVAAGETSPYYLFHPWAPTRIAQSLPEVRCIAILRDPVERAWSHFQHNVARGFEELSFTQALAVEPHRLTGAEAVLSTPGVVHLGHRRGSYVARGRYAEQLARYQHALGSDRLLVVFTEELERAPSEVLGQIHAFLGLSPRPTEQREHRNQQAQRPLPADTEAHLRDVFSGPDRDLAALVGRELPW